MADPEMTPEATHDLDEEKAPETDAPSASAHGAYESDPRYAAPPIPPTPSPTQPPSRTPFLAAFFSFFPGLGNVYNGLYLRGITFFLVIAGLILLASESTEPSQGLIAFSVAFTWLFNVFDAYRQATLINYGYTPDADLPNARRVASLGSGGLVAGGVVFAIGFYGLLHELFGFSLAAIADYWYLLFMGFGAFLIVRTIRERKLREAEADEAYSL